MNGMGAQAMKLLLVEDNEQQRELWVDTVVTRNSQKKSGETAIELNCSCSVASAEKQLDGSFDGVIIDWKLGSEDGGGVMREMSNSLRRIPFYIYAASPLSDHSVANNPACIGVSTKSEGQGEQIREILDLFRDIYDTGLTRIIGGRGEIEKGMLKVFTESIMPQRKAWIEHSKKGRSNVEKALLRHTLNHLIHLIDQNQDPYYPEEVYIYPMDTREIMTGRILEKSSSLDHAVVLSPACDLILRKDGNMKTDQILLVSIESADNVENSKNKKELSRLRINNFSGYYHFLPNFREFDGGYINFRKLASVPENKLDRDYRRQPFQISPPFIKDIISRFSSYYARQGQPEIQLSQNLKKNS